MIALLRLAVACIFIAPASAVAADDVCQDPRVPAPIFDLPCHTYSVRIWDGKVEADVTIAAVPQDPTFGGDVIGYHFEHFLRLPDGKIVRLGEFLQYHSGKVEDLLLSELDVDGRFLASNCCKLLFHQRLERIGRRYCSIYHMRFPFWGKLEDCDGRSRPAGTIGLIAGATTWREAIDRACSHAIRYSEDTNRKCDINDIELVFTAIDRDDDGELFYIVALKRNLVAGSRAQALSDDYLVYRVDARGGVVALAERTIIRPRLEDWTPQ